MDPEPGAKPNPEPGAKLDPEPGAKAESGSEESESYLEEPEAGNSPPLYTIKWLESTDGIRVSRFKMFTSLINVKIGLPRSTHK